MKKPNKKITKTIFQIIVLLALLAVPAICLFIVNINVNLEKCTSGDWVTFGGEVMSYIGTVVLGGIALFQTQQANALAEKSVEQTEKANELSKKLMTFSEREHSIFFGVEEVILKAATNNCMSFLEGDRIRLCDTEFTPQHCVGFVLSIFNYSNYPIVNISIETSYPIGRERKVETLHGETDTYILPNKSNKLLICNSPDFEGKNGDVVFKISCKNIFEKKSILELKVDLTKAVKEDEVINFTIKPVKSDLETGE